MTFLKRNRTAILGALFLAGFAIIQFGVPKYQQYQQQKATSDFFAGVDNKDHNANKQH